MHIHPNVASALSTSGTTNNPAQAARAARAGDAQLQNVSFGEIVSRFARGLSISDLQTSSSTPS